jgi:hypothetical protein
MYRSLVSSWGNPPLRRKILYCDTGPHVTHLVAFVHTGCTAGNPTSFKHLPSLDDILAIADSNPHEDAIMMARDKIACLDKMSLEGDIPDDVSDIGEAREKALFTGS